MSTPEPFTLPLTTAFVNSEFRQAFPEFTDPGMYPDQVITQWVGLALTRLDVARWGTLLNYGVSLFVAHYLSLARMRQFASRRPGGSGGALFGPAVSKSVGPVSVSYDLRLAFFENAGTWNLTSYGVELWQLMGQMGAGGIQVNSCGGGPNPGGFGNGYFAS